MVYFGCCYCSEKLRSKAAVSPLPSRERRAPLISHGHFAARTAFVHAPTAAFHVGETRRAKRSTFNLPNAPPATTRATPSGR